MVYTGKPSTGCQTCRSRRIKCDETRPHCNACIRSSRECPGYPHPLDVRIRPQRTLTWIAENPGRSVASSAKDDDVDMKESVQNSTTSPELSSIPSLPLRPETPTSLVPPQIPGGLYLPMEDTVTGLFFSSYVYAPRDPLVRTGSMELLPRLYAAAPVASPVRMGALAVAYFSVASWTRQEHLLRSARQCFVNTLALTREALQGDVEKSFDEVLMAMLLLYIYEEFDAIKENRLSDKAHLRGAIALINKYRPLNRDSCLSSTLTNAVQTEIINVAVEGASPLLPTTDIWPLSLPIPQLASSRLTMTATAVVRLRQRWVQCSAGLGAPDLNEVEEILSDARQIDSQLIAWTQSLPQHWDPIPASFIPQSVLEAGIYQGRCDCYRDFFIAETWNRYRTSRLAVQRIILHTLCLLPGRMEDIESTTTLIHTLATDTCATVPFFLGSQTKSVLINASKIEYPLTGMGSLAAHRQTAPMLGGWFVLPSLESLLSVEFLPEDQINWVKGQVQRVLQIYTSGLVCS